MRQTELLIIGGGPAGLTAAIYAGRARLDTLIIEKGIPGGQSSISANIENYPGFPGGIGGPALGEKFQRQAEESGATFAFDEITGIELGDDKHVVVGSEETYHCQALLIASGASPTKLGVPGEEDFAGRGVSYCATCDGAFFADREVAVVGGGDSAVDEALFLTRFANKVTIVHRRDELRAERILQERAFADPKIDFAWNALVKEIVGDGLVERIVLEDTQGGGQRRELPADGVFIYIGNLPNTAFMPPEIEAEDGYVVTNEAMETSVPGVFAAGDVRKNLLKQISVAVGEGAIAAVTAQKYLEERKYARGGVG